MEVDLEATKLGGNDHGQKRSDLEKAPGEVVTFSDTKRPREGNHDHLSAMVMEMDDGDEDEEDEDRTFEVYYKDWLLVYGKDGACSFEAETEYGPMLYTDGPMLPISAGPYDTMEVFFVKVTEILGGLQWPLAVYGDVAVRDSLDRKRNYLFRRDRNKCQTLTSPQDSLLELTGPSRAILLRDEPVFEIDLKVKGEGNNSSSEDDVYLCRDVFGYNNISYRGKVSYAKTKVVSGKHSTLEVKFAHVKRSIEATIIARITEGSGNFSARLTACSASIGEDVVLLDSRGKKVSVIEDDKVELQRRVVVVEEQGELILRIKAVELGDTSESSIPIEKEMTYPARSAHRSEGYFPIGSCRLQMIVAWSYLP